MKKISIILSTGTIIVSLFISVLFVSCNKGKTKYNDSTLIRPCDNIICLNGGTCLDGLCKCAPGFEGPQCVTRWSERFVGNYITKDDCDTSALGYYNSLINPDPNAAYKLRLFNVGVACPNAIILADINPEKTSISIPFQKSCGDLYVSGYGNMSGDFLNIYLVTRDTIQHTSTNCSIILDKQ